MTFGKAIKEQRIKKGLTQAQLAEMLGKAESTVRTWELDRSSPDRKALYACVRYSALRRIIFSTTLRRRKAWTAA